MSPDSTQEVGSLFRAIKPRRRRSFREFAEQEIVLPQGPRKGLAYTTDFMPFGRDLLDEMSGTRYGDFYLSGPVQGGKTLHGYVIPALVHLFEYEEDVILGAPVVEMAKAAYMDRLLPVIEQSRYAGLLPKSGGGSRGGVADAIRFGNGATARFIGAGGGDQQISSYTARVVVATELDKMDEPGKVSRESDPVTKLKARTASFGRLARFYGECTMSIKEGRIHREVVEFGTDSRVFLPCQHCGTWIWPERKGLVGWQEAANELDARRHAAYQCPSCNRLWSEEDRQKSIKNPRVVAKDQRVTAKGDVEGPMPPTLTYGFRWNAMASPLLTMGDIAVQEWKAEQSGRQADKKAVDQFVWAEAWEEDIQDLTRPEVATVLQKIERHERGVIPPETVRLTMGIDVGSYVIWWTVMAWYKDARGHVVDFGARDVPLDPNHGVKNPLSVLAALRTLRDDVIKPGWGARPEGHPDGAAPSRVPDRIFCDSGYEKDVVYRFVMESGQPRYLATKGFGTSSRHGLWHSRPAMDATDKKVVGDEWGITKQPGDVWLVQINADHWKGMVHDGFWAAPGAPGSLTLFNGAANDPDLRRFARQIVAEQREYKDTGDKMPRVVWVVKSRQNHYLDTTSQARCAADMIGIKLAREYTKPAPMARPEPDRPRLIRPIRTKY